MTSDVADRAAAGRHIALVIDDAPDTLGVVSDALEGSGITVLVARSGEEGLALARRVQPDVILLDAMMPGMDGFETCRRLKSAPVSLSAPVIFMTGLSEPEHIAAGLQAGGVDYVTKPVVLDELIARITRHILNARAIRSARAALDYSGHNIIAITDEGRLSWGTDAALECLSGIEALIGAAGAGPVLAAWLEKVSRLPVSQVRPLVHGGLTLTFIGSANREVMVRVRRAGGDSDARRLERAFGLTSREAEVLVWLSHGKTNRDIADILTLSARTVNKHLEQIFHKMGVDNRTSAAVMADRILQMD